MLMPEGVRGIARYVRGQFIFTIEEASGIGILASGNRACFAISDRFQKTLAIADPGRAELIWDPDENPSVTWPSSLTTFYEQVGV